MSKLNIVARFRVNETTKEEVVVAILKCAAASRAEKGNIYYDLTENTANPAELIILEEWASQEAIDFHNTTPHFKEMIKQIEGKAQVEIIVLSSIK